ncbi:MAG: hypothetical protein ACRDF4_04665, partial [Rhabdochlamydiaceae bacterium]
GTSCVATTAQDNHEESDSGHQHVCDNANEIVLIPSLASGSSTTTSSSSTTGTTTTTISSSSSATTTSASCVSGQLTLAHSDEGRSDNSQIVLAPGQCITLTFSGTISFGESGNSLIPSTAAGQTYVVHVIASDNAEMKLGCTLPLSETSCTTITSDHGQYD